MLSNNFFFKIRLAVFDCDCGEPVMMLEASRTDYDFVFINLKLNTYAESLVFAVMISAGKARQVDKIEVSFFFKACIAVLFEAVFAADSHVRVTAEIINIFVLF